MNKITLTKKDFRIDTFRSGGKGGQHQNTTDSGVRITHIETGISAESREERYQIQNKKIAFKRLAEKLKPWFREQLGITDYQKNRNTQSFGGEYVRTYNLYANRITDHRTGVKINGTKSVKDILDGGLDIFNV